MSAAKSKESRDVISAWTPDEINGLELGFLHRMFDCTTVEGVEVTVAFARFMSKVKLDPDNYPIFLKMLQFENHWVVDALIGDANPEKFFLPVQPNRFILSSCFRMFERWRPGGIYPTSLLVLFGLLKASYENPYEGNRIYPLTITDVNNLGKHLDEGEDQKYPVNRTILHILDRIASLADPGSLPPAEKKTIEVATQANYIRGKFLDSTKRLREAIPAELLKRGDYHQSEIAPSWARAPKAAAPAAKVAKAKKK